MGYRLPSITNGESANAYTHLTYSNLPFIEGAMSVSATGLKTPMLNGNILGASYSRDVVEGKLFAMLEYQKVNYQFTVIYKNLPLFTDFYTRIYSNLLEFT